jgi:hypothetical protein
VKVARKLFACNELRPNRAAKSFPEIFRISQDSRCFAALSLMWQRIIGGWEVTANLPVPSLLHNNKFGSRTVSYNPPRHLGVGFRRDF